LLSGSLGGLRHLFSLPGSASKGIMMKHGKKNIVLDENRRNTYRQSCTLASGEEPSVLTTFDGDRKLLIPVSRVHKL